MKQLPATLAIIDTESAARVRLAIAIPLTCEQIMFTWIRALAKFPQTGVSASAIEQLVQLAAERSLPAVRERLTLDCASMCPAEMRGYVRARAWSVVRRQTRNLATERNIPADIAETLVLRALDRTARAIVTQPPRHPVMPLPAPHVQLRIAG